MPRLVPVFDLDGTLLDSDEALVAAFVALGVDRDQISFGHVIGTECTRLGLDVHDYVRAYDTAAVQPFAGVTELLAGLERWGVCSNKHPDSGHAELRRLGWTPEVALFTDAFGGGPKQLEPVLAAMGLDGAEVLFVGDTSHDRRCARRAGARFALAAWNPRAEPEPGDVVLAHPAELAQALELG